MLKVVSEKKVQALCICPTRELAQQIGTEVLKMGKYMVTEKGMRIKVILREERYEKGATMEEQVIIGTPGKVWTLINMRVMGTADMRVFVLDEADEMLALGGLGDTSKRIRQKMPKNVQTLFFSATWTASSSSPSSSRPPCTTGRRSRQRDQIFNDQVRQCTTAPTASRRRRRQEILFQRPSASASSLCTGEGVELGALLKQEGHQVSMLQGNMDGLARDKVLEDTMSTTRFLITTNVLSRHRRARRHPRHTVRHAGQEGRSVRPGRIPTASVARGASAGPATRST